MANCSVDECDRNPVARGWCGRHYQRWYSTGDPAGLVRRISKAQSVPVANGELACTRCLASKPRGAFGRDRTATDRNGRARWCNDCRRDYEAERYPARSETVKVRARASGLRTRYGLSPEQFQAMLDERQGRCDICGEADPVRRLCVDHDHACCPGEKTCGACIRGLLCNRCNRLIGHAQDDPTLLTAAVAYVTRS